MMRTRSASKSSTTLPAETQEKTSQKKISVGQRCLRSSGIAVFSGTEDYSSIKEDLMQKGSAQSTTHGTTNDDQQPISRVPASGRGKNASASLQLRSKKKASVADTSRTEALMYCDSWVGPQYDLRRRNNIFSVNKAEKLQDFQSLLKNYYKNLLTVCDTNTTPQATANIFLGSDCDLKTLLTDKAADHPSYQYPLRNSRSKKNTSSSDSTLFCADSTPWWSKNYFSIENYEPSNPQPAPDDAFPIKVPQRSCLRNRDHTKHRKLSDDDDSASTTVGSQAFDYVLRSDRCLLRLKRSFIEKMKQKFDRIMRSTSKSPNCEDSLLDRPHTLCLDHDTAASCHRASKTRRVSFLEPEKVSYPGDDDDDDDDGGGAEVMGQVTKVSSGQEVSSEGRVRQTEDVVSPVKDDPSLWSRSTTIFFGIVIGLRMLYDAWAENLDLLRGGFGFLHLFGNRSSVK